jgi:hypothetical protein
VKTCHQALLGLLVVRVPLKVAQSPFAEDHFGLLQKGTALGLIVLVVALPLIRQELKLPSGFQFPLQRAKNLKSCPATNTLVFVFLIFAP